MRFSEPNFSVRHVSDRFSTYAARLQAIFAAMDLAYSEVAGNYHFQCSGCEDNCCQSHFSHHTYVEFFYLHHGWKTLEPQQRAAINSRAIDACRPMAADVPDSGERPGRMCPLNSDGLCGLYPYRPMICRLHGIPHALQRPDGKKTIGPGCDAFYRHSGSRIDALLDRTAHYRALAALEREFRRSMGLDHKFRLTVAEMILQFTY